MIDISEMTLQISETEQVLGKNLDEKGQELFQHLVDVRHRRNKLLYELAELDILDTAFSEALRTGAVQKEAS